MNHEDEKDRKIAALEALVGRLDHEVRSREDFLSIAAHELKTPIASMMLKFQLGMRLLDGGAGTVSHEKLTQLFADGNRQMSRLTRLIDNLLDVSRLQSGKLIPRLDFMDLTILVREVVDRFTLPLAFAKCALTLDLPATLTGNWDADRLDQVLTNLLTNVLRYAPGSAVTVTARHEQGYAVLTVADQGPGISLAHQAKIFDRYERGAAGSHKQGLGLGLYVTREIIEAHGGVISLRSAPGQGAAFEIRLPS